MKKNLHQFFVKAENTLKEVMQKIDINGQGIALIVDDEFKLRGLVTDGDIRRSIINGTSLDINIQKIMNANPTTLPISFTLNSILNIFQQKRLHHIPVINGDGTIHELLLKEDIHQILQSASVLFPQEKTYTKHNKILVIGGAGYIGSVLVRELLAQGYAVKVLDMFLFGKLSLQELEKNSSFELIEGDTSNLSTIIQATKGVDAVVHLAEIVGDPACALDPEKTQQMNYLSTILIASVCKHFQINRLIYASSCSVYGASESSVLLKEISPLGPVSLYARMKMESENALLKLADGLFSPTILRLATVFGISPRMRFDLVVNTLTLKAIKEKKITVFGGDQWRPNVHVSDVAKAIIAVLRAPLAKVGGEIFNVGSNQNNFTINQIGKLIKENIPGATLIAEEKNIDKRDYRVDFSKINQSLDYQPLVDVKKGIQEIILALQEGKYNDYQHSIYYNDRWYLQQLQTTK